MSSMLWGQVLANGVVAGANFALVALGFTLVYSIGRFFHFAHGGILALAACLASLVALFRPEFLWIGLAGVIVLSAMAGLVVELGVYRQVRRRGGGGLALLLSSLGVYVVLQNLLSLLVGDEPRPVPLGWAGGPIDLGIGSLTPVQIVIIVLDGVAFSLVVFAVYRTRFGRRVRAVAENPELSAVYGVRPELELAKVAALAGALAGLAGILIAADTYARPTMGFQVLLMGVVAVVIGGVGSVGGALVGGVLVGILQHVVATIVSTEWSEAFVFAVLVAFLLWRPNGLLGVRPFNQQG